MKQEKINSRLEHAGHSASDVENEMDKMYHKTERACMTKWGKKRVSVMEDESRKPYRETVAGKTCTAWENEYRKKSICFKAHLHSEVERAKCLPGYKGSLLFSRKQTHA